MTITSRIAAFAAVITFFSFTKPGTVTTTTTKPPSSQKIQVAILLDVSGSMSGLIEQAKAQLWNMVNTMGKAQCTDQSNPQIELALYEYGRPQNGTTKGYVKQLSPFSNDLDGVSKILFGLNTDGGDEYCGQVIYTSLDELKWDTGKDNYKVIFIAGNEDFLQGSLHYTKACTKAKEKGIIVNTIYCGSYEMGIREHWNLLGECGNGSFSNINHNAREVSIPTPYDSALIVLNTKINSTYIGYGALGAANHSRQVEVDKLNFAVSSDVAAQRVTAKGKSNVYDNRGWDLIDANKNDSSFITKMDKKMLPDSLKNKTPEQLKAYVQQKADERVAIQKEIAIISDKRNNYIAEQKAKATTNTTEKTLESEVERTIKEQARRFNLKID
jgi:hypothetical protein